LTLAGRSGGAGGLLAASGEAGRAMGRPGDLGGRAGAAGGLRCAGGRIGEGIGRRSGVMPEAGAEKVCENPSKNH